MRELTSHKVNGLNESINIIVLDEPGSGNACHEYRIEPITLSGDHPEGAINSCHIKFQKGPITEAGVNGISIEALLAVVEDRLKGFQSGQYATRENALALTHVQEAMHWLHHRTRDRVQRGVEGTMAK